MRNRCPSCTLPIGYVRCRAMEKVIETSRVSCPNAKYGCKENTAYGNRFSHEKVCVFTPCFCPIVDCNYSGYYKDLNNHVRAEHKDDLISFVWNTRLTLSLDLNEKTTILQEENDGDVIVVQVFKALHAVYLSVSCIAPLAPGVGKFSCGLLNITVGSLLKQGFMVKNVQKVTNELPEDGFMLIPSYLLSGNENLNLQIWIGRGRVFVHS